MVLILITLTLGIIAIGATISTQYDKSDITPNNNRDDIPNENHNDTPNGKSLIDKTLQSAKIAFVALISLDIVLRTTATSTWDFLYNTEGLFFWGLQITIFLFILSLNMNRDENSKPVHVGFIWTIAIIAMIGLFNQLKVSEYFPDKSSSVSNTVSREQVVRKKVFTYILEPGKWREFYVSLDYKYLNIEPSGNIRVRIPNGRLYDVKPDVNVNAENLTHGTYRLKPLGKKSVKVRITLTPV